MTEIDNDTWSLLCDRLNEVHDAITDAAAAHNESDLWTLVEAAPELLEALRTFNAEAETEGFPLRYVRRTALAGNFDSTANYIRLVNQNDARAGVPPAGPL